MVVSVKRYSNEYEKYEKTRKEGVREWTVNSLMVFSLKELESLSVGIDQHPSHTARVNQFLWNSPRTEWSYRLALLMSQDSRLATIEAVVSCLPYDMITEMDGNDRVVRDIAKTTWVLDKPCEQWNNLLPLSQGEFLFYDWKRAIKRSDWLQNQKTPMLTLSEHSRINRDLYRKVQALFVYPQGMDNVFGGYKPDLYFTLTPSLGLCYHHIDKCTCSFIVRGNHPVTSGTVYTVVGKGLRTKVNILLDLINREFIWSNADGLMSRVDRCCEANQQVLAHCRDLPVEKKPYLTFEYGKVGVCDMVAPLTIVVDTDLALVTPHMVVTEDTVKKEIFELERATPLVRGKSGYVSLMGKLIAQSKYSGTILHYVHLALNVSRIDCRHENCACSVTLSGDMGFTYRKQMGKDFLSTVGPMIEMAFLWYNCAKKMKVSLDRGDFICAGFVDVTEPQWQPITRDLSVWELSLCLNDFPSDILNVFISALMTARPEGNVMRFANKLTPSDRFIASRSVLGEHPDISNISNCEFHLYQTDGKEDCEPTIRSHWNRFRTTAVRVVGFDYSFVRVTEGWPSCYHSVGHVTEDMWIMCDLSVDNEQIVLLPPMPEVLSPWLTFYNSTGQFMSFGLQTGYPLDPRGCNGVCGDIMVSAPYVERPGTVVKYQPYQQRVVPELLWQRASGKHYYYDPVWGRVVETDLIT